MKNHWFSLFFCYFHKLLKIAKILQKCVQKAPKKPPRPLRETPKRPQDSPKTSPEPALGPSCGHLGAMLGSILVSWWPSWLFLGRLVAILNSYVAFWLDFASILARLCIDFDSKLVGSLPLSIQEGRADCAERLNKTAMKRNRRRLL